MEQIFQSIKPALEPTSILILVAVLLILNTQIFKRFKTISPDGNITQKSISLILILIGALVFILSLPIDKTLKGQILSFLGIIISAGIALSSTTILGNVIAGIMNNSMKRFRIGDLIKVGDLTGRVTKKSIFHTEIQLEDSNFITFPNLFIANNPVKLTRKTNTVISTSVSLGYDVSRTKIEEALKEAARATGLTDPYVYITNLGDFSVVYKIHGFLDDSSKYFSTGSLLNGKVMDTLHEKGIEIVSPTFMNQRRVDDKAFIPAKIEKPVIQAETAPEDLVFDQAIESEKTEKKKKYLENLAEKIKEQKEKLKETKDDSETEKIKASLARMENLKEKIEKNIQEQAEKDQSQP
jgi:small-conductance mechanosensitive channel